MKNPHPVHLMTPEESRARGWAAEARDADGHLMSQHGDFDTGADIVEYVTQETERGHTVTIWPKQKDQWVCRTAHSYCH